MSFVYKKTGPGLWTVGYHEPGGKWIPDSDHDSEDKAADRVAWLNGSGQAGEKSIDEKALAHFMRLAKRGNGPGCSSGEARAAQLVALLKECVAGLDSQAFDGMIAFALVAYHSPAIMRELLK